MTRIIQLVRIRKPGVVVLAVDDEVVSGEIPEVLGDLLIELLVAVLDACEGHERSPTGPCNACK